MIPILQMAYYWDLDLIQDDTHEDASNKEMTNIKMCLTKMMMQRCVWDFLPAGAVSVRLTRPSGSSTCSIEPLIQAGCGIDFLSLLFVFFSFFLNWVCLHRAFETGWMWCGMVCLFSLFLLSVFLFVCFYRTRVRSLAMLVSNSLTHWLTHDVED